MSSTADADRRIEQLVTAFENATIDAREFDHEAHLMVSWRFLQEQSLLDAIRRFSAALKRLTRKLDVPGKYHETITCFYLIKIAERQAASDWPAFKDANPDLFARNPSLIRQYYSKSLLASEDARRAFVLPDLGDKR
jgi:hypothetical protein